MPDLADLLKLAVLPVVTLCVTFYLQRSPHRQLKIALELQSSMDTAQLAADVQRDWRSHCEDLIRRSLRSRVRRRSLPRWFVSAFAVLFGAAAVQMFLIAILVMVTNWRSSSTLAGGAQAAMAPMVATSTAWFSTLFLGGLSLLLTLALASTGKASEESAKVSLAIKAAERLRALDKVDRAGSKMKKWWRLQVWDRSLFTNDDRSLAKNKENLTSIRDQLTPNRQQELDALQQQLNA